jgi:hypothetical protein
MTGLDAEGDRGVLIEQNQNAIFRTVTLTIRFGQAERVERNKALLCVHRIVPFLARIL